jgi:DNA-binding transcriptional LysR family regulator
MRSLNLDQLRTLVAVAELGSFSAAARSLNLTQPAVSLQIRELEHRFGVKLIERMAKRAYPTAPGKLLAEQAKRIFAECEVADGAMRRYRDGWLGRVRIGTTMTALTYELPPIVRQLHQDHPGIDLVVTNMPTRDSVDRVLRNEIDLALVTLPVKSPLLKVIALRNEMLVAIFPKTSTDIPDVVTPDYVARHPFVVEQPRGAVHALIFQWLAEQLPLAVEPMQIGIIEAVKSAVASGLGMSIVPDVAVAVPGEVIVRPLQPEMPCTLGLIEHRNKPNGAALEIVRDALLGLRVG